MNPNEYPATVRYTPDETGITEEIKVLVSKGTFTTADPFPEGEVLVSYSMRPARPNREERRRRKRND